MVKHTIAILLALLIVVPAYGQSRVEPNAKLDSEISALGTEMANAVVDSFARYIEGSGGRCERVSVAVYLNEATAYIACDQRSREYICTDLGDFENHLGELCFSVSGVSGSLRNHGIPVE